MNTIAKRERAATAEEWSRFLKPLVMGVAQPPTEADFMARVSAIAFAMPDVPTSMLTEFRQREAVRRFRFFPTPNEIAEWLEPDLADRRRTMAVRAAIDFSAPRIAAPDQRAPWTDADRAAAREKVAMIREAITSDLTRGEVKHVRRAPVDDETLVEACERLAKEGNRAAATRAASLRRKMGIEA